MTFLALFETLKIFRLREMSLYEECSLLKKLESYGSNLKKVPAAYRLRRKLLVRKVGIDLCFSSITVKPIVFLDDLEEA